MISFGVQTEDMGYARIPNGTGNFVIQTPSFNVNNESVLSTETETILESNLYPNPVKKRLTIQNTTIVKSVKVYSVRGQLLRTKLFESSDTTVNIDLSQLSTGVYFLSVNNSKGNKFVKMN
ncbi:T9SS type A sorting domain-containing protein [Polaribacter sp.]|nr:T9SS type A sorting domain-containing protein [Polaribacter sp.]MDB4242119.1 T9SS type A sorting domain-containing protein [Polaribacter sp.]